MKEENDSIEQLKKKLYSRTGEGLGVKKRRRLRDLSYNVRTKWGKEPFKKSIHINKNRILTVFLVLSALFFVGSLAVSAFFFFADRNTVSSNNIVIEIQGPTVSRGGDELSLQVQITNENPVPIEDVGFLVEFPDGTRSSEDLTKELLRLQEGLGTLAPGERVQKTIRAVLFGEEGNSKEIKTTVEYRVKGSNAIFYKEQLYDISLSSAPLSLNVSSVEKISSGQEVEFTITVASNSDTAIKDILLSAKYPFGFEFISASPKPFSKNNVWKLGEVKSEEKRVIRVRGKVTGENDEERVFRFAVGIAGKRNDTKLETPFVTSLRSLFVTRPFIGAGLAINGDVAPNPIILRDSRVRADITWANNLPDKIFDAEIEVKLSGSILDKRSVKPQRGFYRSSDNTVLWSRETDTSLATLGSGARGAVSLSFSPIAASLGEAFRTPTIVLDVTVRGKRVSESNVPEVVESTVKRTIKVATDLALFSRAAYFSSPFSNTGPIPPKVGEETTYTIVWRVTNSTNPVGNVVVSASLPSYVRWVGAVSPNNAPIDFNEIGGQIRWRVGSIPSHTAREVAFQVAFSPSVSQIETTPVLVNRQVVDGVDTFTTARVIGNAPQISTQLSGDPGFPVGGGGVIE